MPQRPRRHIFTIHPKAPEQRIIAGDRQNAVPIAEIRRSILDPVRHVIVGPNDDGIANVVRAANRGQRSDRTPTVGSTYRGRHASARAPNPNRIGCSCFQRQRSMERSRQRIPFSSRQECYNVT